ncbi:MAG: hypothetical protein MJZ96_01705 [Paludibacteraceae bacterium]|nr:hypothetical protein [Paludibacteraceae bacterium]
MPKTVYKVDLCVSDLKKFRELSKAVETKNGIKRFIPLRIVQLDEPNKYGNDAFIAIDIKKENQVEGENYIVGNAISMEQLDKKFQEKHQLQPDSGDDFDF